MTQKIYRTAQGKVVDLGALQLKNESVRAVGNLPVNARGDILDANNRPIDSKNQQVARQYNKQVTNVNDDKISTSRRSTKPTVAEEIPAPPEDFDDNFVKPQETPAPAPTPSTGLAGAMSRARNK